MDGDILDSIWFKTVKKPKFERLEKNIKTDVLIVGGGMAGVLCAYMLQNAGIDYVLTEAKEICSGITQKTTAKITCQHGLIYDKIIKNFDINFAKLYFKAQDDACKMYSKLCKNIDCDYEIKDSYVFSVTDKEKIDNEILAYNKLGLDSAFNNINLPFDVAGVVCLKDQAQFHPLKFAYGLSKDLNIYENTKVVQLLPNKAITNNGEIIFKRIIIATHFPIDNKRGSYFLKMYQHRSYVIALKNAQNVNGMYVDEKDTGLSFRNYKTLLLLGGGGHRTGKQGGNWKELEQFAQRYYSKAKIVGKWATQDCMTLDGLPYIGRYSKNTPDMYVATGFNKWGMTSSMVAATLLTDMIMGKNNEYESVFSPSRSIMRPQLAVNAFESLIGLITPTAPRCPHMGCALKYNRDEHSWDCSCHGSRFDQDGQVLDNPATDDKKLR